MIGDLAEWGFHRMGMAMDQDSDPFTTHGNSRGSGARVQIWLHIQNLMAWIAVMSCLSG